MKKKENWVEITCEIRKGNKCTNNMNNNEYIYIYKNEVHQKYSE